MPQADFAARTAATPAAGIGVVLAMVFAFIGGLILNVMPCVLPILAMKALALAGHGGKARHDAAKEGFAYAAGAVLSFLVFGLVIVLLRQGGAGGGLGLPVAGAHWRWRASRC